MINSFNNLKKMIEVTQRLKEVMNQKNKVQPYNLRALFGSLPNEISEPEVAEEPAVEEPNVEKETLEREIALLEGFIEDKKEEIKKAMLLDLKVNGKQGKDRIHNPIHQQKIDRLFEEIEEDINALERKIQEFNEIK